MRRPTWLILAGVAAIIALKLYEPPDALMADSGTNEAGAVALVKAAEPAVGYSGEVRMNFVRSGARVVVPLEINGDRSGFRYRWVRVGTGSPGDVERELTSDTLLSPLNSGFYELQLTKAGITQRVSEPRLAVMIPFEMKLGAMLNGYSIGRYPSEWGSRDREESHPEGFIEVLESEADLVLTRHLTVRDFITHDSQRVWPRYVAVDPRVLDKIELVLNELARRRGEDAMTFNVQVHSGFRTPLHNSGVEGAARDSRHLYGDAADIAIDADGDGKFTIYDAYRVEQAVEWIERSYPELIGGLGVYSSTRFSTPYTHIDARGERKRWRG